MHCNPQSDATAYMLATNMVSFVHLFAETLAGEYVAVCRYPYELVPTSRDDDRFGVMVSDACFILRTFRNG
ncbi:hypothetical protein TNCV_1659561, partial [Trichonephila clavipes]